MNYGYNYNVYLTFKTDKDTSEFLKAFAHACGKSQPELINDLCLNFKEHALNMMNEDCEKNIMEHNNPGPNDL